MASDSDETNIKVAVRVRPFTEAERKRGSFCVANIDFVGGTKREKQLHLLDPVCLVAHPQVKRLRSTQQALIHSKHSDELQSWIRSFKGFDHFLWSFDERDKDFVSQETVFQQLGTNMLNCAFAGVNASLLAYGQTGAGKSYTMFGKDGGTSLTSDDMSPGIIPRSCFALFHQISNSQDSVSTYFVEISFLEVYNNRLRDLLRPETSEKLRIRENKKTGVFVEGLTSIAVSNAQDCIDILEIGLGNRTKSLTKANDHSSRSHAIFTLDITHHANDENVARRSRLTFVDLAGSERFGVSGTNEEHMKEAVCINQSLSALADVISVLSSTPSSADGGGDNSNFVPYRNSTLTRLLKDVIGGNSKTTILANISPSEEHYNETISTLRYVECARQVMCQVHVNVEPSMESIVALRDATIQHLRSENNQLKSTNAELISANSNLNERLVELETLLTEKCSECEHWKSMNSSKEVQSQRQVSTLKENLIFLTDEITVMKTQKDTENLEKAKVIKKLRNELEKKNTELELKTTELEKRTKQVNRFQQQQSDKEASIVLRERERHELESEKRAAMHKRSLQMAVSAAELNAKGSSNSNNLASLNHNSASAITPGNSTLSLAQNLPLPKISEEGEIKEMDTGERGSSSKEKVGGQEQIISKEQYNALKKQIEKLQSAIITERKAMTKKALALKASLRDYKHRNQALSVSRTLLTKKLKKLEGKDLPGQGRVEQKRN
eukprot:g198.t1